MGFSLVNLHIFPVFISFKLGGKLYTDLLNLSPNVVMC